MNKIILLSIRETVVVEVRAPCLIQAPKPVHLPPVFEGVAVGIFFNRHDDVLNRGVLTNGNVSRPLRFSYVRYPVAIAIYPRRDTVASGGKKVAELVRPASVSDQEQVGRGQGVGRRQGLRVHQRQKCVRSIKQGHNHPPLTIRDRA